MQNRNPLLCWAASLWAAGEVGVNCSAGGNLCSFPRKGQKHQSVVTWLSWPHHSNCISFVTAALLEHQALSTSSNFTNFMSSKTKARAIFVFTYADYWVNLLTCNHKITFLVRTQKNSEYKPYIPVAQPSITAQLPQRTWSAGNTRFCRARRGVFLSPVLLRLLEESQAKLEGSELRFRGSKWKRVLSTKACRGGSVFYPDKCSFSSGAQVDTSLVVGRAEFPVTASATSIWLRSGRVEGGSQREQGIDSLFLGLTDNSQDCFNVTFHIGVIARGIFSLTVIDCRVLLWWFIIFTHLYCCVCGFCCMGGFSWCCVNPSLPMSLGNQHFSVNTSCSLQFEGFPKPQVFNAGDSSVSFAAAGSCPLWWNYTSTRGVSPT